MSKNFTGEQFTKIPNSYLEAKAAYRNLTREEASVLAILERESFGFHREWAVLSLAFLELKTGMVKPSLCRALKSLLAKGVIEKRGEEAPEYRIQTNPRRWEKKSRKTVSFSGDEVLSQGITDLIPRDNELTSRLEGIKSGALTDRLTVNRIVNSPLSESITPVIPSDNDPLAYELTYNRNVKETWKETLKETSLPATPGRVFRPRRSERGRSPLSTLPLSGESWVFPLFFKQSYRSSGLPP